VLLCLFLSHFENFLSPLSPCLLVHLYISLFFDSVKRGFDDDDASDDEVDEFLFKTQIPKKSSRQTGNNTKDRRLKVNNGKDPTVGGKVIVKRREFI
jgi:hypothetical protein